MNKPFFVFMGTPDFAVPSLRSLLECEEFSIPALITQPDKPSGRGQKLTPPPTKVIAEEFGIPVFQPASIKNITFESNKVVGTKSNLEMVSFLNSLPRLDAFISVAYGKIIPNALIQFSTYGVVNVHPSLLPRWRGAAPIQHALFAGDKKTGVCIMSAIEELDAGPVYSKKEVLIAENDDFGSLHNTLAEVGADLLVSTLEKICFEALLPTEQEEDGMNYAEKWEREDQQICWQDSSIVTTRRIRASSPYAGARTKFREQLLKIYKAHPVRNKNYPEAAPGTVVDVDATQLIIASASGEYISLEELQSPGKKRLGVADFLRGHQIKKGEVFL